ncbi:MAG: Mitochondrial import inner membrane translocase subunit Tim17-B [Marteilia pararefringens]
MRIFEDCGYAYVVGVAGGGFFHSIKGFRQAPQGLSNKLLGGFNQMRVKSPQTAGSFAIFGTLFAATECTLYGLRKKEDLANPIISGFVTSAALSCRSGLSSMMTNGMVGAMFLGVIELVAYKMNRIQSQQYRPMGHEEMVMEQKKALQEQQKLKERTPTWLRNMIFGAEQDVAHSNSSSAAST